MRRQQFIPARNSRHRLAALSLYRALLRSASRIRLPDDLPTRGSRSAIQHVIRKRFVNNRPLTSLRLVYASMAVGYKFLSLLSRAQDQASPEYARIESHLRRSRPLQSASPLPNQLPSPSVQEPFLANVSKTDVPYYVPTYTLRSKTRTLNLCTTSHGLPFLRLKKPQPYRLSKMVGRKEFLFEKKLSRLLEIEDNLKQEAVLEDRWDRLVAAQMRREGLPAEGTHTADGLKSSTASFSWSAHLSKLWCEWQVERMWQDWVARGEALSRFVEEQGKPASSAASSPREGTDIRIKPTSRSHINVGISSSPPYPAIAAIEAQLGHAKPVPRKSEADPFTGPRWTALVQSEISRLAK